VRDGAIEGREGVCIVVKVGVGGFEVIDVRGSKTRCDAIRWLLGASAGMV
jgi:hypothetical protein